jgi:hypothetical protein
MAKTPKPGFEYVDGDYEWDVKIKREPANPNNGTVDGGRENPSWTYGEEKLGPIPSREK